MNESKILSVQELPILTYRFTYDMSEASEPFELRAYASKSDRKLQQHPLVGSAYPVINVEWSHDGAEWTERLVPKIGEKQVAWVRFNPKWEKNQHWHIDIYTRGCNAECV